MNQHFFHVPYISDHNKQFNADLLQRRINFLLNNFFLFFMISILLMM